ncbi:hypothetical protein, partial [Streptomyces sp. SID7958]
MAGRAGRPRGRRGGRQPPVRARHVGRRPGGRGPARPAADGRPR